MGWRFHRTLRTGPINWNLSKRGVGWSIGIPGLRYGRTPADIPYISIGIPQTGIYWIKYFNPAASPISAKSSLPVTTISVQPAQPPSTDNQKLLYWKKS
jgi:hypothetical protein